VTYKTLPASVNVSRLRSFTGDEGLFGVTFASSSTVRNFIDVVRNNGMEEIEGRMLSFSIGPKTSETLRSYGIEPSGEALEHTIPGLVAALVDYFSRDQGAG
jgi:uroporphyrinogen III methyltransferase / synthase